jgi:hypothetical protein
MVGGAGVGVREDAAYSQGEFAVALALAMAIMAPELRIGTGQ